MIRDPLGPRDGLIKPKDDLPGPHLDGEERVEAEEDPLRGHLAVRVRQKVVPDLGERVEDDLLDARLRRLLTTRERDEIVRVACAAHAPSYTNAAPPASASSRRV